MQAAMNLLGITAILSGVLAFATQNKNEKLSRRLWAAFYLCMILHAGAFLYVRSLPQTHYCPVCGSEMRT